MIVRLRLPTGWTEAIVELVYAGYLVHSCWESQGELRAYVIRPADKSLPNGWQEL
jgi:hypothetical protein